MTSVHAKAWTWSFALFLESSPIKTTGWGGLGKAVWIGWHKQPPGHWSSKMLLKLHKEVTQLDYKTNLTSF